MELSDGEVLEGEKLLKSSLQAWKVNEIDAKARKLKEENEQLKEQLTKIRKSQGESYSYLQKKLLDSSEQLLKLTDKVERKTREFEQLQESAKEKEQAMDQKNAEVLSQLNKKHEVLEAETLELRKFEQERPALLAKVKELEETRSRKKESYEKSLAIQKEKNKLELEKLETEMQALIGETMTSIEAHAKARLPDATKRTMMDVEKIDSELTYQNYEVGQLKERCQRIEANNAKLAKELAEANRKEAEEAKRLHTNEHEYRMLRKQAAERKKAESEASSPSPADKLEPLEHTMSSVDDALKAIQISPISYTESKKKEGRRNYKGQQEGEVVEEEEVDPVVEQKLAMVKQKLETVLRDLNCIFEDDIAMLVLETVDKAVSDPKLVKKVNIRMKRKSKEQQQRQQLIGDEQDASFYSVERRSSVDDSLSWASDDETTTVASAGMMSIGDLSSLTGAEGKGVAAKVPVGAMGESLEEDEEEFGLTGSRDPLRVNPRLLDRASVSHLTSEECFDIFSLIAARLHNYQLQNGITVTGSEDESEMTEPPAEGKRSSKDGYARRADRGKDARSTLPKI